MSGSFFWTLSAALGGFWQVNTLAIAALAYVTSWLAGYVTLGAPGGIGVREAALLLLLGGALGEAETLVLAIGLRVATTFGDVFLFGLSVAVQNRWAQRADHDVPGRSRM